MDAIDIERLNAAPHLRHGSIEVICGSMFSGKTEELMRRLRRAAIAKMKVEVYKPATDIRYDQEKVVSHDANAVESTPLENAQMILLYASDADVVGIDEAQFFDEALVYVVSELADSGKRVIIAGLDMDFRRNPFGPMPQLMALADSVLKSTLFVWIVVSLPIILTACLATIEQCSWESWTSTAPYAVSAITGGITRDSTPFSQLIEQYRYNER